MRRAVLIIAIYGCLLATSVFADSSTQIRYEIVNLGSGSWQYTYEVSNLNLSVPIEEFTIWFDYGSYKNLAIAPSNPPVVNWDEIVVQPEPVLLDNGFYDSLTMSSGIMSGDIIKGFSVTFDWLGTGNPGPQFYEIVNPTTYKTIVSGYTVPEPLTALLLGMGALIVQGRLKSQSVKFR